MKIANGLEALDLTKKLPDREWRIHPALLWDNEEVILVDTGFPGQVEDIRSEMEAAGVPFERLTKIIITHQDIDHIGSLREIVETIPHPVEVIAHSADKPYIEGDRPLIKMNPVLGAPTAKVDTTVEDGEILPYCGGIRVIFTPGHTPGHISLYHVPSKTLITGDAMVFVDGQLAAPPPYVTPDMETAIASLKKFALLDVEKVLCYHGHLCETDVNRRLAEFAK